MTSAITLKQLLQMRLQILFYNHTKCFLVFACGC